MIKCDSGIVEFSKDKSKALIAAELSTLMHALVCEEVLTKEDIKMCCEDAFKPNEEIIKEVIESLKKTNKLIDLLSLIVTFGKDDPEQIARILRDLEKNE